MDGADEIKSDALQAGGHRFDPGHPTSQSRRRDPFHPATAIYMKKEYDFSKMKELKNPKAAKKQAVGINLSPDVVDYSKGLADETGLPYEKLIDLYLPDCAKNRKKLRMKWVA
jgi:hypothetical protein